MQNKEPLIEILMSTYNGESYLHEQLQSILHQTYTNWSLIVRDDGSSDSTVEIIKCYVKEHPNKVQLFTDTLGNLGSTMSFSHLIEYSSANYFMLSDQDDFWLKDKIETTLECMLELELANNLNKPLMVFTDLTEVDSSLNLINESFLKSQKLNPKLILNSLDLLALNVVAGCTTMCNKASKQYIVPIPASNIIHDQWMAVNISYYGFIKFVPRSTILYRQHISNVVGAHNVGLRYFVDKFRQPGKQFNIYYNLITNLKFKVSIIKFIVRKFSFTIKRLK